MLGEMAYLKSTAIFKIVYCLVSYARATIDMNLSQFEFISNHLAPEDCRRLVAALHYRSFELPNALSQAESKVSPDEPCLKQLLHWNSETGGGKSENHELVSRRLRQLGRAELANWLSKQTLAAVEHDFNRTLHEFDESTVGPSTLSRLNVSSTTSHPTRAARKGEEVDKFANRRIAKQDVDPLSVANDIIDDPTEWTVFDTISWTIVVLLFLIIIVLMVYLTMASPCCRRKKRRCKYCHQSTCDLDCPAACNTRSRKCPKARRRYTESDCSCTEDGYDVRDTNKAALELMGVQMPSSPCYCRPQHSHSCGGNSSRRPCSCSCGRSGGRSCTCGRSSHGDHRPSVARQSSASALLSKTIDIHQKIAIPMTHQSD